ncbi:MAG: tRNA (N(6)-L-threonylcarbamoyladenosine(37)-C(2))-methylthiotransferase MtaB [Methylicorpusculum sp.]|uniref:tRNA (N(6)-L-threonylcarbamoyladenosine(37)-C(2))- methylthiotransferase MtaB n=1 Tax=Methylicorpusculum sp. TaxID=2713644 RepID=UPI00271C00C5|nr:tRNA (N(6)-L-threonylcarbamoyladenosine(37)-C(2))-methylthiotransferase MtaB [Methylicorpusculum sp.]MDO8845872.1 tRNA (N(6)-L-threonylcarbamoyladenosine(37)-C(2))-methylthiotransferase MtaB [Methylicorpusculum sp.]MDO8939323.1 tRNA (N(6)-L-threonylcarbamoyladenosine(37)-C(2))-methylthiotransferase MtaB [Methylicorpusculum sp.]MDP2201683.1 tRNA (N(6)-L-threonylcarbamoyladenosine(37)-C(2))-methylthiotransferase MtaB [Methylicorpusculum sp.]
MLVHLKTLGCRLNEAELESWAQGFQKTGHQVTRQAEAADLIVINSCAVTQDASRKSRNLIRRIHRENPTAKLVVSGCYASLNREEAEELMGVDLVIGNQDKDQLVEKTLAELNMDSMPVMSAEPGEMSLFARGRQRAFIKVQDGCRYRCTFCIVTVARGEESSRPIADVLEEINNLTRQNIQEIVLTGVHLGGYGHDRGSDLVELIKTVLAETDVQRLRLGSLEPWELSEEFFELFKNPRVMPHLHLPLQSGSDTVLRRMARRCKTEEFVAIVKRLRDQVPDFNITTDIIVGFPGETEQEWEESFNFIKQTGFGHIHIFTYSKREGTKAATLPNPVPADIKKLRSQQLHGLANALKAEFFSANLGKTAPVLWEGYSEDLGDGRKRVFGYSPNYMRVACEVGTEQLLENCIIDTVLDETNEDFIAGRLLI